MAKQKKILDAPKTAGIQINPEMLPEARQDPELLGKLYAARRMAQTPRGTGGSYTQKDIRSMQALASEVGLPHDLHLNLVRNWQKEAVGAPGRTTRGHGYGTRGDFEALRQSVRSGQRPGSVGERQSQPVFTGEGEGSGSVGGTTTPDVGQFGNVQSAVDTAKATSMATQTAQKGGILGGFAAGVGAPALEAAQFGLKGILGPVNMLGSFLTAAAQSQSNAQMAADLETLSQTNPALADAIATSTLANPQKSRPSLLSGYGIGSTLENALSTSVDAAQEAGLTGFEPETPAGMASMAVDPTGLNTMSLSDIAEALTSIGTAQSSAVGQRHGYPVEYEGRIGGIADNPEGYNEDVSTQLEQAGYTHDEQRGWTKGGFHGLPEIDDETRGGGGGIGVGSSGTAGGGASAGFGNASNPGSISGGGHSPGDDGDGDGGGGGGTWFCTAIRNNLGISEDIWKMLGKFRSLALSYYPVTTQWYIKTGPEMLPKMTKDDLVYLQKAMVEPVIEYMHNDDFHSAFFHYAHFVRRMTEKYLPSKLKQADAMLALAYETMLLPACE